MSLLVAPAYGAGGTAGGGGSGGAGAIVATATPSSAYGSRSSSGDVTVTTETVTVSVSGTVGAYTIAWEAVTAAGWTITTPTLASTKFSKDTVAASTTETGTFRAKITNGVNTAYSNTVTASVSNVGPIA